MGELFSFSGKIQKHHWNWQLHRTYFCLFESLLFLTFHNINQPGALLKSAWMQSPRVPPPLRQPSPTCSSTPAHLVIPHSHPTGKEHSASPCFPSSLLLSVFHSARSLVGVLPYSEPFSLLHPAHPCPQPFFLLGKEIPEVPKAGLHEQVFLSHFAPSLPPMFIPSMKVTSLRTAPLQLLLIGRKGERQENPLAFISGHFTNFSLFVCFVF